MRYMSVIMVGIRYLEENKISIVLFYVVSSLVGIGRIGFKYFIYYG